VEEGDKSIIVIDALLEDNSSVEVTLIDEDDSSQFKECLTAAIVNKEYGDRRFTGSKSISVGALWPKATIKCRIGYTVTKNDLTRRYTYAKNQCEGDYWVKAGFKTKIIKARVTGKGEGKTDVTKQDYVWSDAQYRIMTYALNGNEYWGYTSDAYISVCVNERYKSTVDLEQNFNQHLYRD